jgi:hypothetical protein
MENEIANHFLYQILTGIVGKIVCGDNPVEAAYSYNVVNEAVNDLRPKVFCKLIISYFVADMYTQTIEMGVR